MSYRGLITASYALGGLAAADAAGRARRRAVADVARRARHLFRAAGDRPRAGDAELLDWRGSAMRGVPRGGILADPHGAPFIEKAKLEPLVAALSRKPRIVYLEDVRARDWHRGRRLAR